MASLQSRLSDLITSIGTDIKALQARTPTVLSRVTSISDTSQPSNAVEWWTGGSLIAKLLTMNPVVSSIIQNRSEVWLRVKSRDGTSSANHLLLDSDGLSDFATAVVPAAVRAYSTGDTTTIASGGGAYVVPLNAEDYDLNGMHDNVTNNTRLTAQKKGLYLLAGRVSVSTAVTQDNPVPVQIVKNGVTATPLIAAHIGRGMNSAAPAIPVQLDVGDYVELRVVNNLSIAVSLFSGSGVHFLTATYLGAY